MSGIIMWTAQDRVAVEVQHPVDIAIVHQWSAGDAADVSAFVDLDRTEVPTAEFYPVDDGRSAPNAGPTEESLAPASMSA